MQKSIEKINNYETIQYQWERYASVRTRPRRLLQDEENPGFYFPPAHQPIVIHPLLKDSPLELKEQILVHTLYKYLNDIANIEKDIINLVAYKITKDQYFLTFSRDIKHDALSIIIDESYHAYMAQDFITQVEIRTNIARAKLPEQTSVSYAIEQIKNKLPLESAEHFEFIAVCISEHALTNDLISVARAEDICKTFYSMMRDHTLDEGRHARFFETLLDIYWHALPESQKAIVGQYIPTFINEYFNPIIQKKYDENILKALGLEDENIKTIIEDTHANWSNSIINGQNIVAKQMIALLKRTKIFSDHTVYKKFCGFGIN